MTNNAILRRLRYILTLKDQQIAAIFKLVERDVNTDQIEQWLKKEEDEGYQNCSDRDFAYFLNGLIIDKRGKKNDQIPTAEKSIDNNQILKKLKIAFNLTSDDVQNILHLAGLGMSQHEISAFFRNPKHKHFRPCKDQVMRNFLMGLQLKYRPKEENSEQFIWPDQS